MSLKRLSKTECAEIAEKMTVSISNEIKEIDLYFSNLTRGELEKLVPQSIKNLFDNSACNDYIYTQKSANIYIGNRRYIWSTFNAVPVNQNNDKELVLKDEKELIKANEMYDLKIALKKKKELLKSEIEQVLFKLSTYKRISEHLPEALNFLPEVKQNELPQLNISEFRKKIGKELNL